MITELKNTKDNKTYKSNFIKKCFNEVFKF